MTIWGELDLDSVPPLRVALLKAADRPGPDLVVDLSETVFLGCCGLGARAAARSAARQRGRRVVVRGAYGVVLRVLAVSDLSDLLEPAP